MIQLKPALLLTSAFLPINFTTTNLCMDNCSPEHKRCLSHLSNAEHAWCVCVRVCVFVWVRVHKSFRDWMNVCACMNVDWRRARERECERERERDRTWLIPTSVRACKRVRACLPREIAVKQISLSVGKGNNCLPIFSLLLPQKSCQKSNLFCFSFLFCRHSFVQRWSSSMAASVEQEVGQKWMELKHNQKTKSLAEPEWKNLFGSQRVKSNEFISRL